MDVIINQIQNGSHRNCINILICIWMSAYSCLAFTSCSSDSENTHLFYLDSPYYRNVLWGDIAKVDYYSCYNENKTFEWLFNKNSTIEDVYVAYAELEQKYPNYVSSNLAGMSSDEKNIKYYTIGNKDAINIPKIIIVCSQHGFEKNSTFGSYYFIRWVLENENVFCRYIVENVRIIIFPVANPYGFNSFTYCNANGVNINRNWPVVGWRKMGYFGSSDYSGNSPLDQQETESINHIISDNSDAILLLDYHTYGESVVEDLQQINTLIIPLDEKDKYYDAIFEVANKHLENISLFFYEKYNQSRTIFSKRKDVGYILKCDYYRNKGCLNNYGSQMGIISLTFEGFNGFPKDSKSFTLEVAEANANLMGSFIYFFLKRYSQFGN